MLQAQSLHPLRAPRSPQQRVVAFTIVAGLHLLVLAAILIALNKPSFIHAEGPITTIFVPEPHKTHPTPATPQVTLIQPTKDSDTVKRPDFRIDDDSGGQGLRPTLQQGGGNSPVLVEARAIAGTHTIPTYPAIDTRLGHEGNVMLKLTIDSSGAVTDAIVEHSSGYDSLDKAAAEWVKAHWRYAAATRDGAAIASSLEVTVAFRLTHG
jgi:TonB family protein